jgi:hypothetical protein
MFLSLRDHLQAVIQSKTKSYYIVIVLQNVSVVESYVCVNSLWHVAEEMNIK